MSEYTVAVIPAHDEAEAIGDVVRRAVQHVDRVIVVDDGSSDATADIAEGEGATVLRLVPNRGKGGALVAGLDAARDAGATRVVTLDADGEHDPDEIPKLLAALDEADVALGWRRVYRSGARRALNGLALFWFRVLDPSIRDTICGFRAFRTEALAKVHNDAGGFAYEHEVILKAVAAGLRLRSVEIATVPNAMSHVTPREVLRANNHFDRWVLRELGSLPLPLWRKGLLAVGCGAGLALGAPAQWVIERSAGPAGGARRG
ncbi:MAG: glycosyltransferase family 2 protein [Polyangiales bacterium]